MASLQDFIMTSASITAPCLEHVRLFEPLLRRHGQLPASSLASMGVDAFAASDFPHCRAFAVSALVLRAGKQIGNAVPPQLARCIMEAAIETLV